MPNKTDINTNTLPNHVAIIMDGNGRWAKQQSKIRVFGHKVGVTAVRDTVEGAAEINALMELLVNTITKETKTLMNNNIRLVAIGNLDDLPKKCLNNLNVAIEKTSQNNKLTLVLALSYSSKKEIVQAIQQIAEKVKGGNMSIDDINEESVKDHLYTHNIPDPELLIRTSGELRISNFLMWQIAYSELYFTKILWPDFRRENLYEALIDFQSRERRFGKTSEQIEKENA
jgi:undecaprenyl diphosphate synthase